MGMFGNFNLNVSDAGGSHKTTKSKNTAFNINKYNQPTLEIEYNQVPNNEFYYDEEQIKDYIKELEKSRSDGDTLQRWHMVKWL